MQIDADGQLEQLGPDPGVLLRQRLGLAGLERLEVRKQQLFLDAQVCRQVSLEPRTRCSRDIPVAGPESTDELLEHCVQIVVIHDETRMDGSRR